MQVRAQASFRKLWARMAGSAGVSSTSPNVAIRVTHRVVASTVDSLYPLYPLLGVKRLGYDEQRILRRLKRDHRVTLQDDVGKFVVQQSS